MVKFVAAAGNFRQAQGPSAMGSQRRNIQFEDDDLEAGRSPTASIGQNFADAAANGGNAGKPASIRSDPEPIPIAPILTRRTMRSATVQTFRTVDAMPTRPDWHAGQEPGLDPTQPNGGRGEQPILHAQCEITVVDYSEEDMKMQYFDNQQLIDFLEKPQEDWSKCRWINVNGLSWDVIQALGKKHNLHKLAIEDMINTNNRTKVDWYTDHIYIVMTLQKLVHLHQDDEGDSDSDSDTIGPKPARRGRLLRFLRHPFGSKAKDSDTVAGVHDTTNDYIKGHTEGVDDAPIQELKTLQRYHGGPNQERMAYMEKHSALTKRKLAVGAEQVSIFLTSDNTVIAFFQTSAEDLETPILKRLSNPDTILRRSCDASMLVQAIVDAIIDLAIPVTTAYQDIIGDLELNVLTEPSITHTTNLYILTSEITKMRGFVNPVINLINALRDHKRPTAQSQNSFRGDMKDKSGVTISPMAQTYLGDVEDHIILITDSLDNMRRSCDNMIDLIFNTISAYQNESMKQLTVVTIIFLPLSFMTGYFGMNITDFPSIHHNEVYFWEVAIPVGFAVCMFLMRDMIKWYFTRLVQRRGISQHKKRRIRKEQTREKIL